jgi:hypothetical protein
LFSAVNKGIKIKFNINEWKVGKWEVESEKVESEK